MVPVFSAQGLTRFGAPIPALNSVPQEGLLIEPPDSFTHTGFGGEEFRISSIMDRSILPTLSDWVTLSMVEPVTREEGKVKFKLRAEWHVPQRSIESLDAVVYGQDVLGHWQILAGADPQSGEADTSQGTTLSLEEVNSAALQGEGGKELNISVTLPTFVPGDPSTQIIMIRFYVARIPYAGGKLPKSPPPGNFDIPQAQ